MDTYWISVNWPWIVLAIAVIFVIFSMKNKVVRKKLNKMFGWPPEP